MAALVTLFVVDRKSRSSSAPFSRKNSLVDLTSDEVPKSRHWDIPSHSRAKRISTASPKEEKRPWTDPVYCESRNFPGLRSSRRQSLPESTPTPRDESDPHIHYSRNYPGLKLYKHVKPEKDSPKLPFDEKEYCESRHYPGVRSYARRPQGAKAAKPTPKFNNPGAVESRNFPGLTSFTRRLSEPDASATTQGKQPSRHRSSSAPCDDAIFHCSRNYPGLRIPKREQERGFWY